MKNLKKTLGLLVLVVAMAMILAGCASSAGLTESQKVGAKNSPAVLMSIYVSPKAEYHFLDDDAWAKLNDGKMNLSAPVRAIALPENLVQVAAQEVKTSLETEGGFTFVQQEPINEALTEAIEKAKKKSSWSKVKSVLKGDIAGLAVDAASNLAEGVLTEAMEEVGFKQYTLVNPAGYLPVTPETEDFSKAAVKAAKKAKAKAASLVYVTVEFGVHGIKGEGVPYKAYCVTSLYITDTDGNLEKTVKGAAFSAPMNYKDFIANPASLAEKFPMLLKESVLHTASNLNAKTGLFEIIVPEADTDKLITDGNFGFHDANKVNISHFSEGPKD